MRYLINLFAILTFLTGCDDTSTPSQDPVIIHECALSDAPSCATSNSVESCVISDTGKRIKKITDCGDGTTCWQGECLNITCDDDPICINGAKECIDVAGVSKQRICGNFDNDSCFEWQIQEPENNCTCSEGEWICGCTAGNTQPCDEKDTGGCDQVQICQKDGKTWGDCERDPNATVTTYYKDGDTDQYGDPENTINVCFNTAPVGYVDNNEDCDDTETKINPNAEEICDGIDNNCDGNKDEDLGAITYYKDQDEDSLGDSEDKIVICDESEPVGYVLNDSDCDDNNKDIGAPIIYYADTDNDSFGNLNDFIEACTQPTGYVLDNTDCNDQASNAYPDATEECDGIDNNCDDEIDENPENLCAVDTNEEGPVRKALCQAGICKITECRYGYYDPDGDYDTGCEYPCTPTNNGIEICDGKDNNCNGNNDDDSGIDEDPDNTLCSANHIITGICKGEAGCGYDTCQDGFFDDDELFYNGCENGCAPVTRSASIDTKQFDATMDDQNLYLFYQNNSDNLLIREFDYITGTLGNTSYKPLDGTSTIDISVDELSVGYHANDSRFFTVYTKDNILYARTLKHNGTQLKVESTNALEVDGTEASYYNPYIAKKSYDDNRIPFVVLQKSGDYYNLKISTLKTNRVQELGIGLSNDNANLANYVSQTPYRPLVTTVTYGDDTHFPIIYCKKDGTDTPENFNLYLQMVDEKLDKVTNPGGTGADGAPLILETYTQKGDNFCTELMENVSLTSNGSYFYVAYPVAATSPQTIKIEAHNYNGNYHFSSEYTIQSTNQDIDEDTNSTILYPKITAQENTLLVAYQEKTADNSIQHYIRLSLNAGKITGKIAGKESDITVLNQNNTTTSFKSLPFYSDQKRVMVLTQEYSNISSDIDTSKTVYFDYTEPCEDLSSDILAYLPLDGDVTDLYGNLTPADQTQEEPEYPGEVVNITFEPGSMGQRAIFNGTDAYIQLPKINENFNRGITYSLWVYIDALNRNWMGFIDLSNGENSNNLLFSRHSSNSEVQFLSSEARVLSDTSNKFLEITNWIHIAVSVYPDKRYRFFKNGQVVTKQTNTFYSLIETRINNFIGKTSWNNSLFKGKMDEIFIYSRALRDHEVKALYDFAPVSE